MLVDKYLNNFHEDLFMVCPLCLLNLFSDLIKLINILHFHVKVEKMWPWFTFMTLNDFAPISVTRLTVDTRRIGDEAQL